MKGLNLNILNMCDAIGKKIATSVVAPETSDENRHRRPNSLFPVQIFPYLYLGNVEIAKNKDTLKR